MKIALVEMKIGKVPSRPQGGGMWASVFALGDLTLAGNSFPNSLNPT